MMLKPPARFGALFALVAAFVAVPLLVLNHDPTCRVQMWLVALALTCGFWGLVADKNIFVDQRDHFSLSRFQLVAWTTLILPSIWIMVAAKIDVDLADPLEIGFTDNLWWLLGISGASSVGASLIASRKNKDGELADAKESGLQDLVYGEDKGNNDAVDISRVQLLFFTGLALITYFAACWQVFRHAAVKDLGFPAMSANLVTVLGISHATYLANKTISNSSDDPPVVAQAQAPVAPVLPPVQAPPGVPAVPAPVPPAPTTTTVTTTTGGS